MLTFPCVMLNWVRTAYLFAGESNSGYVFHKLWEISFFIVCFWKSQSYTNIPNKS